jgi:hypothetical protein
MSISDYMDMRLQSALSQVQSFQGLENPCQLAIEENETSPIHVVGKYDLFGRPISSNAQSNQLIIEILSNGKTRKTFFVD